MKHVKLFNNNSALKAYKNSNIYITPNLLLNKQNRTIEYNKLYDAEIEYLYGSGEQYIDTGIIPDENTGIYIKIYSTSHCGNDNYAIGLRNDNGDTRWCIGRSNNGWYWGYGEYDVAHNTYLPVNNGFIVECQLNYLNDKKWFGSYNTTSVNCNLPALNFVPQYNIRLLGSAGIIKSYSNFSGRIYNVKISQDSNIIMDLIPVRIGETGYLFNKIDKTLFGNDGIGQFTLGPDI